MIACFGPLPPSRTGVADYSVDLLRRLSARAKLECFVADTRSELALPGWPIHDYRKFRPQAFQSVLYQLGNNPLHRFAYDQALQTKGVIVLHDALLQHMFLGEGWDAWQREFTYIYGPPGTDLTENLRGASPGSHESFFQYPLVRRVVEASRRTIVHSEGARARVLSEAPSADVRVIPLAFGLPRTKPVPRRFAREELSIPQDAFVLGCIGYMRETRLLPAILRVFRELRARVPNAMLVQVGEFASPELERSLAGEMDALQVIRPGRVSASDVAKWGAASDVIVNLRYPSAGESSAIALQMMGLGLPVIVTENAESGDFPADVCMKLPHNEEEDALLLEYLLALQGNPELGATIGANAREYVRSVHDPERALDQYLEALEL